MRDLFIAVTAASVAAYAVAFALPAFSEDSYGGTFVEVGAGAAQTDTTGKPVGPAAAFLSAVGVSGGGDIDELGAQLSVGVLHREQIDKRFYVGAGLDLTWTDSEGSTNCQTGAPAGWGATCDRSDMWSGSLTAQAGVDVGALLYIKGGVALGVWEDSATITAPGGSLTIHDDGPLFGWVIGGGALVPLTEQTLLGAEVTYTDYETRSGSLLGALDVTETDTDVLAGQVKLQVKF